MHRVKTAGGEVLIVGDYQGGMTRSRRLADSLGRQHPPTRLAISDGDGGRVIVWAIESAQVHGSIQRNWWKPIGRLAALLRHRPKLDLQITVYRTPGRDSGKRQRRHWLIDSNNIEIVLREWSAQRSLWQSLFFVERNDGAQRAFDVITAALTAAYERHHHTGQRGLPTLRPGEHQLARWALGL